MEPMRHTRTPKRNESTQQLHLCPFLEIDSHGIGFDKRTSDSKGNTKHPAGNNIYIKKSKRLITPAIEEELLHV